MMKPANHVFLFRSIINYHNIKKNPLLLKKLQQQIPLPITFDIYGRAIYERNSEDGLSLSCEESLSIYASSYAKSLSDIEPFIYIPDNLTDHFDAGTDDLWRVTYSLRMTMDDKRQVVDRFTLNVNMISLTTRLLCYLNDQVFW